MKKKKKNWKKKALHKGRNSGRRNTASAPALTVPRRPRAPRVTRVEPPEFKTIGAAVAGSVGSALVSGIVVNQKIAEPETMALLTAVAGGVGAYFTAGDARVAFAGAAAAGAGQYALAKLGGAAIKKMEKEQAAQPAPPQPTATAAAPPPPAPPAPPRRSAYSGGAVVDLFRENSARLDDDGDDDWSYAPRDADLDGEPLEIVLDDAA